jgi:hypothetical protein
VAGTSADLVLPCAGSTFCASGTLDVSVAAYNRFGVGEAGTASWTIRPAAGTTTTQAPVVTTTTQPPVVTTTTQPPVVVTTTTTTTPPPPPPLPSAGVQVISTVGAGSHQYERKVTTAPPADWASHSGTCEVVNTTYGSSVPIACSGGAVTIDVDLGSNALVVRAHGPSGSVDSKVYNAFVRDPIENCGGGRICQPLSVPASDEGNQLVGGGIGLLATAWLLTLRNRRMRRGESE